MKPKHGLKELLNQDWNFRVRLIAGVIRWVTSWEMEGSWKRWSNLELAHQYPATLQYWVLQSWFCLDDVVPLENDFVLQNQHISPSSTSILLWFPGVCRWAFWNKHQLQVPPHDEVRQGWVNGSDFLIHSIRFFHSHNFRPSQIFYASTDVTLAGLEVGLLTMKKGEFSRFLFNPQYAFGDLGCPPRIPAASVVLYEVEVLDFLDSGQVDDFIELDLVGLKHSPIFLL